MFTLKCPWDIPSSILVGKRPTNSLVILKNTLLQSCLSVYLIRSNVDREYFDMFKAKVRFFNATHNIFFHLLLCRELLLLLWWLQLFLDHHSKRRFLQLKSPNITHQAWITWLLTMWICLIDPEWLSGKIYEVFVVFDVDEKIAWFLKCTVSKICPFLNCEKRNFHQNFGNQLSCLVIYGSQLIFKVSSKIAHCTK